MGISLTQVSTIYSVIELWRGIRKIWQNWNVDLQPMRRALNTSTDCDGRRASVARGASPGRGG
jgi:hypothetical protein